MSSSEELKLLVIFSLLAAANLMVLFLILFFKKSNNQSNKVLGLLVFIPSIVLVMNPLFYLQYFSEYLVFIFIGLSSTFLFGPLLLLYIHLVQDNKYQFKTKDLFHFFPVFFVVFYGIYISLQPNEINYENYLQIASGEDLMINIINIAQLIHFAIYITWSIRKVNLIKTKTYLSIVDKTNYKWLKFFVTRLLYLNILILLIYVVQMSFFPSYVIYSDLLATPLASSCFYPIMVYKSFANKMAYDTDVFDKKELSTVVKDKDVNENVEDLQVTASLILENIKQNKSYLKSDYTIIELSKELQLSQRTVSDSINQVMGKNFSDLMNDFRIEESKVILLEKSKDLTIDAIAEMSGFKSRATFYRVFKDKTSFTPAQYVKNFNSSVS